MEKLKIVINGDENIAKKAREYFKFLGYYISSENRNNYYAWSVGEREGDYYASKYSFDADKARLVTIGELRDLVVLKRNDVRDAQYVDTHGFKIHINSDNKVYYFEHRQFNNGQHHTWVESGINGHRPESLKDEYISELKPIEKTEMKEYLEPMPNGDYRYHKDEGIMIGGDWIEIPEGAEVAVYYKYKDRVFFWKDAGKTHWGESSRLQLGWYDCSANMFAGLDGFLSEWADQATVIWKRETLNDQVASAETARQSEKVLREILEGDLPEFDFEAIDAFIESNVEKSGVEKTLSERQSQYGCFEDVAHVTQGMIHLMRQCGYDNMPQPHQMALSMIASKIARIVNGDCNHLDSWHDIGGYSKLIENLIEGK